MKKYFGFSLPRHSGEQEDGERKITNKYYSINSEGGEDGGASVDIDIKCSGK